MHRETIGLIVGSAIVFAIGCVYLTVLDSGCKTVGVMTWHGRACAESI